MILDENLDKRYTVNFRKPQYRALTTETASLNKSAVHWVYGIPCILPDANGKYPCKVNAIRTPNGSIYPIKTDTLSEYTGCEDCNGKPIYEGDIVCKNRSYVRWVQYNEKYSAYITVRKGGRGDYNADYLAKGDSLCRDIEIIGNMWETPELTKQRCYTTYSLEEINNDRSPL